MNRFSLLPIRCLCCGDALTAGVLCRACQARFQRTGGADAGLGICPLCGQVRLAETGRCVDCSAQNWAFPGLDGLFGYQDPAGELLRLYKFGGQSRLAPSWAEAASSRVFPKGPLVPVPALRRSLWRRGWDPVGYFVTLLGRQAGVPVWRVLKRRPSASQKTLDRKGRTENAARAYGLRAGARSRLAGVPLVWLVDDVVTTGATVEACSRLLVEAGAGEVRVFCLGLH